MPYIVRDDEGKIQRISTRPLMGSEMLPHHHAEVTEFLKSRQQNPDEVTRVVSELRDTDADMTRAIEDLITVLLKKNILKMTDLPRQVQDRMAARSKLRVKLEEIYDRASRGKTDGAITPAPIIDGFDLSFSSATH